MQKHHRVVPHFVVFFVHRDKIKAPINNLKGFWNNVKPVSVAITLPVACFFCFLFFFSSFWTESSTSWERRTLTWWPERRGSLWWSLLRWSVWEPRKLPLSTSQTSANCELPTNTRTLLSHCFARVSLTRWPFRYLITGCIVSQNISSLSCWLSWEPGTFPDHHQTIVGHFLIFFFFL